MPCRWTPRTPPPELSEVTCCCCRSRRAQSPDSSRDIRPQCMGPWPAASCATLLWAIGAVVLSYVSVAVGPGPPVLDPSSFTHHHYPRLGSFPGAGVTLSSGSPSFPWHFLAPARPPGARLPNWKLLLPGHPHRRKGWKCERNPRRRNKLPSLPIESPVTRTLAGIALNSLKQDKGVGAPH